MNRREFSKTLMGSIGSYALLNSIFMHRAFSKEIRPIACHWVSQLNEMSLDLKSNHISPSVWQIKIKELFDQVELNEMLSLIDFDKLVDGFEHPDLGVKTKEISFPKLDGLPEKTIFYRKLFGMKKDRAIIPHGHKNMVSCHYVLKGDFHLKHYDKVEENKTHMIIEPTVDEMVAVGSHSSISDEKNNIHWLRATSDAAFTFDVIVSNLNGRRWHVDNIDPHESEKISKNMLRVRKLSVEDALQKYGKASHH